MRSFAGVLKRVSFPALLLGFGVALSLALAEGLLRLFPQALPLELQIALEDSPETRGIADPDLGSRPAPGEVGTIWTRDFKHDYVADAHGFRNAGQWPQNVDIAVIGDSLVFGYGVESEQAWPQVLERLLPGREVLNLGLIGAGPQQHLRIYEHVAGPLEPKLVIVGFFARNDFWDADMFEQWLHSGAEGNYMVWRDFGRESRSRTHPGSTLLDILRRRSYLYTLLRFARSIGRSRFGGEPVLLPWPDGMTLHLMPRTAQTQTTHAVSDDPVFATAMNALSELHNRLEAAGANLLIVLQPSKEETYMSFVDRPVPDYSADLRRELDELRIPYLDLAPIFRERASGGERLFFPTDGHPNAAGYRLTAETVAALIAQSDTLN